MCWNDVGPGWRTGELRRVHSHVSAGALLRSCNSLDGVADLFAELGFSSGAIPIPPETSETLGIPSELSRPRIAVSQGALRALLFERGCGPDLRESLQHLSARLAARAPQFFWLIGAVDTCNSAFAIAAFDSAMPRPRLSALVVQLDSIVDSDTETVYSLAGCAGQSDSLTHCRWLEVLGRASVGRRFYRAVESTVQQLAASVTPVVRDSDASELALLCLSRMLFLSFVETRGWLNRDRGFLVNRFAECMGSGGGFHRRVLDPLFFGTLNTHPANRASRAQQFGAVPFLNGGLFSRSSLEARTRHSGFSDEAIGALFGNLLTRYRFTAREDAATWSETAIDPEMLGRAFESLMSAQTRRSSGAFFTPQNLVREVSQAALAHGLSSRTVSVECVASALHGQIPSARQRTALMETARSCRILDPACGSGAFLVHLLEELSSLLVRLGDLRSLHVIRRTVLTQSIFGVDVNPMAVWLCELRLWLSMTIEDPQTDPRRVVPLPNLDRNIRVGDSLSGDDFRSGVGIRGSRAVSALRSRYARATGPAKRNVARALDLLERRFAVATCNSRIDSLVHERQETLAVLRTPDLFGDRHPASRGTSARLLEIRAALRAARSDLRHLRENGALPFSFPAGFADVAANGGFDIVVGNPPWIRTHNIARGFRTELRRRFTVYRDAAWASGTRAAGAGSGFGSQVDLAALFIERSISLLRPCGVMSLVVPAKLWRSLAGGGTRQFLLERTHMHAIHDRSQSSGLFDAAVYPSVIIASRTDVHSECTARRFPLSVSVETPGGARSWSAKPSDISLDPSSGSPWLLIPEDVRSAFDALVRCGVPLCRTPFNRPLLGVKTGCNDAFLIEPGATDECETSLLRPLIKAQHIRPWQCGDSGWRILWTHDRDGFPIGELPELAARRLRRWRRALERRSDAVTRRQWWSLFRTESADSAKPRVVWADIGRSPRAAVLEAGDRSVALNTCYVVRCPELEDAHALAALLNSRLVAAWLSVVAEPARGGYRRYMGWTMSMLPLPADWTRARRLLAPMAARAIAGDAPSDDELLDTVIDAYALGGTNLSALLEWDA